MQRDTKIRMIGKLQLVEAILEIDSDLGRAPELTAAEAHRIFSLIYICIGMCVCMHVCMYVCIFACMSACVNLELELKQDKRKKDENLT